MTIELKKGWLNRKQKAYSDIEVIEQLQQRKREAEEWFYREQRRYFNECFNDVFFDKDRRQEIFQSAFLKLWTEIDNGRICVREEQVCRRQTNGVVSPMTCSLKTFLMAFARTEYREITRKTAREETVDELFDNAETAETMMTAIDVEEEPERMRAQIVDAALQQMPPRCLEILTLFYYEGKSLDEILEIRQDKNSSKNGLKTAKNKCMNTLKERLARYEMFKV